MKTIIIGLNWLGDIVMSLPTIAAAVAAGSVHVVTRPHLADAYKISGLPLAIHPVETDANPFAVISQLKPLRSLEADLVIVLPDSLRAAFVARCCFGNHSVGFATQLRSFLLDQAVTKPADYQKLHEADLYFMLGQAAGLPVQQRPALPRTSFSDNFINRLKSRLNLEGNFLVVAPGAAFGAAKRWPPARFSALVSLLVEKYALTIIVTGSASEQSITAEICRAAPQKTIDAAGKTSLPELSCLLSCAQGLVCNDSGTMHLAAPFAIPTVVPVGPTDMLRTGPLNPNFIAVSQQTVCPQAPCRQKTCPRGDHLCMESITPEAVLEAMGKLLRKSDGA